MDAPSCWGTAASRADSARARRSLHSSLYGSSYMTKSRRGVRQIACTLQTGERAAGSRFGISCSSLP
eukprot:2234447-Pyramimonas_sp.AAC.1